MWGADSDDILDLEVSPEIKHAASVLEKAGEQIALDSLPLKRLEALCGMKCFRDIQDVWNMSSSKKRDTLACVEQCEAPMEALGEVIESERDKILEGATSCVESCPPNDENCMNRCIGSSLSQPAVNSMLDRVRSSIQGYRLDPRFQDM